MKHKLILSHLYDLLLIELVFFRSIAVGRKEQPIGIVGANMQRHWVGRTKRKAGRQHGEEFKVAQPPPKQRQQQIIGGKS